MNLFFGVILCFLGTSGNSLEANNSSVARTNGEKIDQPICEASQEPNEIKETRNSGISIILLDEW